MHPCLSRHLDKHAQARRGLVRRRALAALLAMISLSLALGSTVQAKSALPSGRPEAARPQLASAGQAPGAAPPPHQPIPPAELERFVDGVVADAMAVDHLAGVSVAVVQGGRTILLKGYGVTAPGAGHSVDPRATLFRIGSLSKTFTWIALMREVERGRVRLEDPVNKYLPPQLRIPDQGFHAPIRIVDLMRHSPGFEDIALGHLFVDDPARVTAADRYLAAHRPRRVREPGQFATYSNYGVLLAGYIVANLEGADFQTVMEREVFGPLGMKDTTFREPYGARPGLPQPMSPDLARRVSNGFTWTGAAFRPEGFEYITQAAPAGSISTTAADMARYMAMQLNGGELDGVRIYGPATAAAFRTPLLSTPEGVNGWAHGYQVLRMPGGRLAYGHGGATSSFFTNMVLIPALDLGVFVTSNTSTGRALDERFPKLIVERFYGGDPVLLRPGAPKLAEQARVYQGPYVSTRRAYHGLEEFVSLLGGAGSVSVSPQGYLITEGGGPTQAWAPTGRPGQFVSARGSELLTFNLDGAGRARSYDAPSGTLRMERAGALLNPQLFLLSAGLTLTVAFATWVGALNRIGRNTSPTPAQAGASIIALGVSALWLASAAVFAVWSAGANDSVRMVYRWPGPLLPTASALALAASVGCVVLLLSAPLTWRGPSEGEGGWSRWRMARHLGLALAFTSLAVLLAARGALTPWSS